MSQIFTLLSPLGYQYIIKHIVILYVTLLFSVLYSYRKGGVLYVPRKGWKNIALPTEIVE